MLENNNSFMPHRVASGALDVLNPTRSVIVDMIMVQLLSMVTTLLMIIIFKGGTMSSGSLSYYVLGLFLCVMMLSGVYARITR